MRPAGVVSCPGWARIVRSNSMIPASEAIDIAVKVLQAPPFDFDESEARRFAEAFKVALAKA